MRGYGSQYSVWISITTILTWYNVQKSESDSWKTARWEKYLIGAMKDGSLPPSDELKSLLRDGVPPQFRSQVWNAYVALPYHLYPLQDFKALYKYCIIIIVRDRQTPIHWPLFQDNLGKPAPENQ